MLPRRDPDPGRRILPLPPTAPDARTIPLPWVGHLLVHFPQTKLGCSIQKEVSGLLGRVEEEEGEERRLSHWWVETMIPCQLIGHLENGAFS